MIKKLKITKYPKIEKEDRYCWGVYGIFDKYNDELLYIGSTKNLRSRQQDHCKPCNWKWGHRELDFRNLKPMQKVVVPVVEERT